jgi:hypothetical protein
LETFKIESSGTTTLTQVWRFHSGWKLWCEWSVVGSFFVDVSHLDGSVYIFYLSCIAFLEHFLFDMTKKLCIGLANMHLIIEFI